MNSSRKTVTTNHKKNPWLISLYQSLYRTQHRSFGVWRLIKGVAKINTSWQRFEVNGPDQQPFYLDLSDVGCIGYLAKGDIVVFEDLERGMVSNALSPDAVILDVGANIGLWSRSLAQDVPKGFIYAFEPSRKTFALLQANTQHIKTVKTINLALSDAPGQMGLTGGSSVLRRLSEQPQSTQEVVHVTTLDMWSKEAQLAKLDFIKIDVEGSEAKVLAGAQETLNQFRPAILFEQAPQNAVHFKTAGLEQCVEILTSLDYTVRRILPDGSLSDRLEYTENTTNNMWASVVT